MCFSYESFRRKGTGFLCPGALAHGAFHTLRAAGQCGADTKLLFNIVAIVVDIAVLAEHARRIFIIVAGRAEPPCNPVPVVLSSHVQVKTPFA